MKKPYKSYFFVILTRRGSKIHNKTNIKGIWFYDGSTNLWPSKCYLDGMKPLRNPAIMPWNNRKLKKSRNGSMKKSWEESLKESGRNFGPGRKTREESLKESLRYSCRSHRKNNGMNLGEIPGRINERIPERTLADIPREILKTRGNPAWIS